MTNTPALYWIRRDLRLADNPALFHAASRGQVIPVYIHADEEEAPWQPGGASRWWLHHSLASMAGALEKIGSRLIIRRGSSLETLQTLARETGATAVFFNRLHEPACRDRDQRVCAALEEQGLEVQDYATATLIEPGALNNMQGEPYRVFTPFWKAMQALGEPSDSLPAPRNIQSPAKWPGSLGLDDLALEPTGEHLAGQSWTRGLAEHWEVGEQAASHSLEVLTESTIEIYPVQRDFPAKPGVSRLSPHLHFGELSPRQAWNQLRQAGLRNGTEAQTLVYLRQLAWRDFAHHVLHYFPRSPLEPMYPKYRDFPWRQDHEELLLAWQQGRTGIPIVDAGMRELWHTGWMHNRVRMVAASLLVKNLRIPWGKGAAWFWDTLVDADLANNTMGWQWSAGCGVDAAPYFRIFNPILQGEKFDGQGVYVRRWIPELKGIPDKFVHKPWMAPGGHPKDYPLPVIDLASSRKEALEALASIRDAAS